MDNLFVILADNDLALVPINETHREGLRRACAEDQAIWDIYPNSYLDDAFDPQFDLMVRRDRARLCYAILVGGVPIGMTAWIEHGAAGHSVEIGNTYIVPRVRGSGLNNRIKRLMLDHAFGCGLMRVAFKIDEVNTRSQAAVRKLGGTKEGVLRAERITWTGRIRDTAIYSILAHEWRDRIS